jgi:hypothetical protein
MKYLKNKTDGTIYEWDEILAANPKCEEVTEEEAYPERFIKPEMAETVEKVRKRTKKSLDLTTEEVPEPPPTPTRSLLLRQLKDYPNDAE